MTYAFSLFNGVMPLGQNALGTSAAFKGNGMCFSTRGLRRRPWKSYGLVEDMEYSWTLRIAGEKIAFQPELGPRRDARCRRSGRGESAAPLGVRPERDPKEVPRPLAPIRPDRLVGKSCSRPAN